MKLSEADAYNTSTGMARYLNDSFITTLQHAVATPHLAGAQGTIRDLCGGATYVEPFVHTRYTVLVLIDNIILTALSALRPHCGSTSVRSAHGPLR